MEALGQKKTKKKRAVIEKGQEEAKLIRLCLQNFGRYREKKGRIGSSKLLGIRRSMTR
jgi:hypothetical protein